MCLLFEFFSFHLNCQKKCSTWIAKLRDILRKTFIKLWMHIRRTLTATCWQHNLTVSVRLTDTFSFIGHNPDLWRRRWVFISAPAHWDMATCLLWTRDKNRINHTKSLYLRQTDCAQDSPKIALILIKMGNLSGWCAVETSLSKNCGIVWLKVIYD